MQQVLHVLEFQGEGRTCEKASMQLLMKRCVQSPLWSPGLHSESQCQKSEFLALGPSVEVVGAKTCYFQQFGINCPFLLKLCLIAASCRSQK